MGKLSRPQLSQLALDVVEQGDTALLARKYGVNRSTIYRALNFLASKGVIEKGFGECVWGRGPGWKFWFDGIDSGRWDQSHSQDSHGDYLAGARPLQTRDKPRLAPDFELQNARRVYELLRPPPADFIRFLRPFSRDKAGKVCSWAGEVHYKYGTAQFYIGDVDGHSSVQLELHRQWFPDDGMASDPDQVERHMEAVFHQWRNEIAKDYGLKLTLRGVAIRDARSKRPQDLTTGHLEKRILNVDSVGKAPITRTSGTDDSPPGPSVNTVDLQGEARNLAVAALSGGQEAVLKELQAMREEREADRTLLAEMVKEMRELRKDFREALGGDKPPAPSQTQPPTPDDTGSMYG